MNCFHAKSQMLFHDQSLNKCLFPLQFHLVSDWKWKCQNQTVFLIHTVIKMKATDYKAVYCYKSLNVTIKRFFDSHSNKDESN